MPEKLCGNGKRHIFATLLKKGNTKKGA